MTITIKYSPTNLADVVDAYNAVAADLAGYGYTISTTPPAPASAPVEQQSVQTAENTDALPVDQTPAQPANQEAATPAAQPAGEPAQDQNASTTGSTEPDAAQPAPVEAQPQA